MLPTSQSLNHMNFLNRISPVYPFNSSGGFNSIDFTLNSSINLSPYYMYNSLPSFVKPQQSPSYTYLNTPEVASQVVLLSPLKIEQKRCQMISNMNRDNLKVTKVENPEILHSSTFKLPNTSSTNSSIKEVQAKDEIYLEENKITNPMINLLHPDKSDQSNEERNILIKSENLTQHISYFRDFNAIKNGNHNLEYEPNNLLNKAQKAISQSCSKVKSGKKSKQVEEFSPGEFFKKNSTYITRPKKGNILQIQPLYTNDNRSHQLKASKSYKDGLILKKPMDQVNSLISINSDSFYENVLSKNEKSSVEELKSIDQTPNDFGKASREAERDLDFCRLNNESEIYFDFELNNPIKKTPLDKFKPDKELSLIIEEKKYEMNFFGEI